MGLGLFGSSFRRAEEGKPAPTDPNPGNFRIEEVIKENEELLLVRVKYPNCTNFEGTKLLMFRGVKEKHVRKMLRIDPHFLPSNDVVARFRPTVEGLKLALQLMELHDK